MTQNKERGKYQEKGFTPGETPEKPPEPAKPPEGAGDLFGGSAPKEDSKPQAAPREGA